MALLLVTFALGASYGAASRRLRRKPVNAWRGTAFSGFPRRSAPGSPMRLRSRFSLSRLAPSATGPKPYDCAKILRTACVGRRPAAFRSAPRLVPCSRVLRASPCHASRWAHHTVRLPADSGESRSTPGGVRPFPAFPVALVHPHLCACASRFSLSRSRWTRGRVPKSSDSPRNRKPFRETAFLGSRSHSGLSFPACLRSRFLVTLALGAWPGR